MKKRIAVMLMLFLFPITVLAEEWIPMPIAQREHLDRGMIGGEGCQWLQGMAISRSNPDRMVLGSDVSGVYVTSNGGALWEHATVGYNARGTAGGIDIDPYNENHILCVGGNSTYSDVGGVYMSWDGAQSWDNVLQVRMSGYRDFRKQILFDPSSYDEELGYCKVAYWSKRDEALSMKNAALYKTTDGGTSWIMLNTDKGGWELAVSETGVVYLGGDEGVYRSEDGGETFTMVCDIYASSVDTIYTRPNEVYFSSWDSIYQSVDNGKTFEKIPMEMPPACIAQRPANNFEFRGYCVLRVSPANPNRMMMCSGLGDYKWNRYYSEDGGKTWNWSSYDNTFSIMPYNNRHPQFVFHPTDESIVYSFGGDWVTRSTDGGKIFRWYNNGNNSVCDFAPTAWMNVYDPDLMFLGLRDYNGAGSEDGGLTWHYGLVQNNEWGGQTRAGYMVSKDYIFALSQETVNGVKGYFLHECTGLQNGVYQFTIREDIGKIGGTVFCYQSPTDPKVLFAGDHVSRDGGVNWELMEGCTGVVTHNYDPQSRHELYGKNKEQLVRSYDNGVTWEIICSISGTLSDMAYNYRKNVLYAAIDNNLIKINDAGTPTTITNSIEPNFKGERRVKSVCVDPVDPNVVYVAGCMDVYANDASCQRSLDGGNTWQVLTRNKRNSVITSGTCGGVEANFVRVHPVTREAYVATTCYGLWRIGPPGTEQERKGLLKTKYEDGSEKLFWFGNGKTGAEDLGKASVFSIYNTPANNALLSAFDRNGDRKIDEKDAAIITDWILKEWDIPLTKYEVYRSADGEHYQRIAEVGTATEYTDCLKDNGTYYYKIKNLTDGSYTMAVRVTLP